MGACCDPAAEVLDGFWHAAGVVWLVRRESLGPVFHWDVFPAEVDWSESGRSVVVRDRDAEADDNDGMICPGD